MSGTATPNTNPAYEKVLAARDASKLTAVDYIKYMFGDSFIELHGDRRYSDDKAETPRSAWSATSVRLTPRATARRSG